MCTNLSLALPKCVKYIFLFLFGLFLLFSRWVHKATKSKYEKQVKQTNAKKTLKSRCGGRNETKWNRIKTIIIERKVFSVVIQMVQYQIRSQVRTSANRQGLWNVNKLQEIEAHSAISKYPVWDLYPQIRNDIFPGFMYNLIAGVRT